MNPSSAPAPGILYALTATGSIARKGREAHIRELRIASLNRRYVLSGNRGPWVLITWYNSRIPRGPSGTDNSWDSLWQSLRHGSVEDCSAV